MEVGQVSSNYGYRVHKFWGYEFVQSNVKRVWNYHFKILIETNFLPPKDQRSSLIRMFVFSLRINYDEEQKLYNATRNIRFYQNISMCIFEG